MKVYPAKRKGAVQYLLIAYTIFLIILFSLAGTALTDKPFIILVLLTPIAYFLWIYFSTRYIVEGEILTYISGPTRGAIEVKNIHEIIKGKSLWTGTRPALAQKGLILKYNRFDEIYLAPLHPDELMHDLIAINQQIKITG